MGWLCNSEECALCWTMHEARERKERERECTSWNRLVTFGDIWWYRHAKWVGQRWGWYGDAHEWLGEHAPWRKQETDISLTPQSSIGGRGGPRARTRKSLQISHTVTSYWGKKTDWSPAKTHFFENPFPYNRLSFGPAWSARAGLISNNPPAAL